MKQIPFSELLSEMYPLVLHNIGLIRLWNDYDGITHTFNKDTIQVNTRLLEPLKDVVPYPFTYDEHIIGDFKLSYLEPNEIKVRSELEALIYHGNYNIVLQVNPIILSINKILEDFKTDDMFGVLGINTPEPSIGFPDGLCEISPLSRTTLNRLTEMSRRMKLNRIKYLRSLTTKVKNKKFTPKDVRNKIYQQLEFINMLQQSFMELNDPDLIVFTPQVKFFDPRVYPRLNVSSIIPWVIMNVYQSIKIDHIYRPPYEHLNGEKEYVLGWGINFWI